MADFDVDVVLRLVDKMSKPATQAAAKLQTVQTALRNMGQSMQRVGGNMTLGFTLPAAGMVKQAVDFDTAMGNLAKVFQGTNTELEKTKSQIMEMARVLPLTQSELAKLFTAANQANIPLKEQAEFVQLTSEFMTAFDTSADNAADALAKLKASQDLSVQGLRELAGVMNIVANQSAASEPQMLELASRIASLGKVAGGQGAVAPLIALGGAAVSMGVDVERASTGLRNMMLNLSAGESGTKKMKNALKQLGLSAGEVQKALSEDTVGTMLNIFERIKELPRAGQLASLNDLFGRRAVDALGPLLGNLPEVVRLLGAVADKQQRMSSVSDEFAKRMERLAPKFQLFMNSVRDVSLTIAEHWIGPITTAMNKVKQFLDSLTPAQKKFAAFAGGITAALGPVLVILGSMATGIKVLIAPLRLLTGGLGKLGASTKAAAGALTALRVSAAGLVRFIGPAGILITGAIAVAQNWEKIAPAFNRVTEAVKKIIGQFQPLLDLINKIVEKVTGSPIGELLNKAFSAFDNAIVKTIIGALNGVAKALELINTGIEKLKQLPSLFEGLTDFNIKLRNQLKDIIPDLNPFDSESGDDKKKKPKPKKQSGLAPNISRTSSTPNAVADLQRALNNFTASGVPATMAAAAPVRGRMPAGMTVTAEGPNVHFKVPPPNIHVTANVHVNSNADPATIAQQAARTTARQVQGALYDGVNEG